MLATISVTAENLAFGEALTPGLRIRLDRVVPLGSTFVPYLWVKGDSVESIEVAFRAEDDIESFDVVDAVDGEALIRAEWSRDFDGFLATLTESEATILDAEGVTDVWTFQLRFDDHEELSAFYRRCVERGIPLDLERVHNFGARADVSPEVGITDAQRAVLEAAFDRGYFEVPRRITLEELAADLDIPDTTVSQTLRRGLTTLLTTTLKEAETQDIDG